MKEEAGEGGSVATETTAAEPMEVENGVEIPFEKARVLKGHDQEVINLITNSGNAAIKQYDTKA